MYLHNIRAGQFVNGSVVLNVRQVGRCVTRYYLGCQLSLDTIVTCQCLGCGNVWTFDELGRSSLHFACPPCYERTKLCWQNIKQRCLNPDATSFVNYGGRGISICERWKNSFWAFVIDNGFSPHPSLTIDRIDNDGNYEPGNTRWATWVQQAGNRRKRKCTSRAT